MAEQRPTHRGSVDYEQVGSDYLEKRQLKRGAAGWVLLAGLGVAWSEPASGGPPEKIIESFVRFQMTSVVEATVGVQGVFDRVNSDDRAVAIFTGRVRVAF